MYKDLIPSWLFQRESHLPKKRDKEKMEDTENNCKYRRGNAIFSNE